MKKITDSQRLEFLRRIKEINSSGYAGCDKNGQIVDRREHPEAIPVQKNYIFGIPDPKPVGKEKIAGEYLWSKSIEGIDPGKMGSGL